MYEGLYKINLIEFEKTTVKKTVKNNSSEAIYSREVITEERLQ